MDAADLRIDRLVLRVPGLTPDEARALGREVAERLARAPAPGSAARVGALELRVDVPRGVPREHLARLVAERIRGRLG